MPRAMIASTGFYVPPRVVTNHDLVQMGIETTHEWIVQRSGIEQRRFSADGEGPADMALHAAEDAIARAGLTKDDVDFIVFCTLSPEHAFPGSGCYLQAKLSSPWSPSLSMQPNAAISFVRCLHYFRQARTLNL